MDTFSTNGRHTLEDAADRARRRRDAKLRLWTIAALVLLLVLNDALLMRVVFLGLLVPLVVDIQRRVWSTAQRRYADDVLALAELAGAKYREEQQQHEG